MINTNKNKDRCLFFSSDSCKESISITNKLSVPNLERIFHSKPANVNIKINEVLESKT